MQKVLQLKLSCSSSNWCPRHNLQMSSAMHCVLLRHGIMYFHSFLSRVGFSILSLSLSHPLPVLKPIYTSTVCRLFIAFLWLYLFNAYWECQFFKAAFLYFTQYIRNHGCNKSCFCNFRKRMAHIERFFQSHL